jgi:F0F1-type ATP synthase membrane subunit b/b'
MTNAPGGRIVVSGGEEASSWVGRRGVPDGLGKVNVDVRVKLAEVRQAVVEARSMPMSASVVMNRAELLQLLDELEAALEHAFTEADRVTRQRDEVIDEGRREAEIIVGDARNERDRLVSDTEVFRIAQRRADEVLAEAQAEADGLRKETEEYVDGKLANFEITLERTIDTVKRGRERLAGRSALDALTEDDVDRIKLPEHLEG